MELELLRRTARSGGSRRARRALGAGSRAAKVLRAIVTRSAVAGHAHVVRGRRGGAVGSTNARVVLRTSPAEAHARVTNGVALHLVDGHLGSVAVDELNEAAALARRDLDIGDLTEALEEGSELVLSDVARKATNEDGGVVGVSELVHLSGRVKTTIAEALHATSIPHLLLRHTAHHGTAVVVSLTTKAVVTTVLGGSSRDTHGSVAAVDTLHLNKSTLLVVLVGEANETIATALARHGVGHDLGRLARRESSLEERNQDVLVDLGAKVANENAVLGATIIPSVNETTTRSPVKLEGALAVRNWLSVHAEGVGSGFRGLEFNKAIPSITRVLVADDLNIDSFMGRRHKNTLDEVLIHPRLELSHPKSGLGRIRTRTGRRGRAHVRSGRSTVGKRHWASRSCVVGGDTGEIHNAQSQEPSTSFICSREKQDVAGLYRAEQQ